MKKTIITLLALASVAVGETVTLAIPTGIQNASRDNYNDKGEYVNTTEYAGYGSTTASSAITKFADSTDGGYMFNAGGVVDPDVGNGEGVITYDSENRVCLTLYPRTGAQGSGEVILLSGQELNGCSVESLTFDIASSSCTSSGTVALTLAVITLSGENNNQWVVLGDAAESTLTLGQSGSVDLTLGSAVTWSDSYKVVAMVDNTAIGLGGGASPAYTLTGMTVTATYTVAGAPETPAVPEPATATLGLLALAGLAMRRRRK